MKNRAVYYALTQKGRVAQQMLLKRSNESQKEWEQKLLGILAMHKEVFGWKALHDLLERAKPLSRRE